MRREPLVAQGKSGAQLERGWLDDGSTVIIKHADARQDWIMQATGDDGRVAALWVEGVFERLPAAIDHATLDVQRAPGGAIVVMRDVSNLLFSAERPDRASHLRVLRAAAQMHVTYAEGRLTGLCPLSAYYTFLSPAVCERFAAEHDVPRLALKGWSRFHDLVAGDVAGAVAMLHADPAPLAEALLARPSTLVHGDLKLANLGVDHDRVVMLDWGTLTTWAPPAVDFAWYLAINSAAVGCEHDELLADIRRANGDGDETALRLALLGALLQLGWEKALGATSDDAETRHRERAGLDWWTAQVRQTLDLWSPTGRKFPPRSPTMRGQDGVARAWPLAWRRRPAHGEGADTMIFDDRVGDTLRNYLWSRRSRAAFRAGSSRSVPPTETVKIACRQRGRAAEVVEHRAVRAGADGSAGPHRAGLRLSATELAVIVEPGHPSTDGGPRSAVLG